MSGMRRRDFISLLGGTAVGWPLTVRAQQPERMRRIGALIGFAETDSYGQASANAFRQGLEQLGWVEGRKYSSRLPLCRSRPDTLQNLCGRIGWPASGCDLGGRNSGYSGVAANDPHHSNCLCSHRRSRWTRLCAEPRAARRQYHRVRRLRRADDGENGLACSKRLRRGCGTLQSSSIRKMRLSRNHLIGRSKPPHSLWRSA